MNFKISRFAGFAKSISNLDFIKVTGRYVGKRTNFRFAMRIFLVRANK